MRNLQSYDEFLNEAVKINSVLAALKDANYNEDLYVTFKKEKNKILKVYKYYQRGVEFSINLLNNEPNRWDTNMQLTIEYEKELVEYIEGLEKKYGKVDKINKEKPKHDKIKITKDDYDDTDYYFEAKWGRDKWKYTEVSGGEAWSDHYKEMGQRTTWTLSLNGKKVDTGKFVGLGYTMGDDNAIDAIKGYLAQKK